MRLGYSLRIFWRTSPEDPSPAPLYLNTATLALTARPTRRLQIKLAATAFEGSADYTFLPVIFGQSQAALVVVPRIFSAMLEGTARLRADRLVTPEIAVQAVHSQPIGVSELQVPAQNTTAVTYSLPHFTSLSGTPGVEMRVSPLNDLTLESIFQYEYVSDINSAVTTSGGPPPTHSISAIIVIPTVASRTLLARNADLILKLGLAVTHLASTYPVEPNAVTPVGGATFDGRLLSLRETILSGQAGASVEYYLDPVLGTPAPHATAATSLVLGLPQDWSIGLQGTFSTTLKAHPLGTEPSLFYPDEVAAAVALPVRHALSDDFAIEFGGRWSDRSPFFTAPSFGFHQRQLWLYLSLMGTSRPTRVVAVATPVVP